MNNYIIITDSSCDLPAEYLKENKVKSLQLGFQLDGKIYQDGDAAITPKQFYEALRGGKSATTSQVTVGTFEETFLGYLENDIDILYIGFSSGLSGTFGSGSVAARELSERYPDRKIYTVDTLAASLGQGLIVYKAVEMKKAGASIEEVRDWVEANKTKVAHMIIVNDLMHLHRGGRLSKTSAIAGSMLGIKPGLIVDNEGKLATAAKLRGRKKALHWLLDEMVARVGNEKPEIVTICHGDSLEDAEYLKDIVKEKFGVDNFILRHLGPVIGAHAGPGTVGLFFIGKQR